MARTVAEIQTDILAAKNADANLAGLNSSSNTAIYNLWAYITALIINVLEQMWDTFRAEVDAEIISNIWGTSLWYVEIAKKFQDGDSVEQLPDNEPYSVIDPAKQIVTRAAISEAGGVITLKVATETGALTATEKTRFEGYIDKIKGAGVQINVVSLAADVLTIGAMTIKYDGQFDTATLETNIIAAIDTFLATVEFNGILYKNRLIDAIEAVDGVINANADTATITMAQSSTNGLGSQYELVAGYAEFDDANSNFNFVI